MAILKVLDGLSGHKEGDELRIAVRQAIFEYSRLKTESLAAYATRKESNFDVLDGFGVKLPPEVTGALLEEGARLSEQGEQNAKVFTDGALDGQKFIDALRKMDTNREKVTDAGTKSLYAKDDDAEAVSSPPSQSLPVLCEPTEDDEDPGTLTPMGCLQQVESYDLEDEDIQELLNDIKEANVTLQELPLVLVGVISQKKKTWAQNKDLKKAIKTDRQHFLKAGNKPKSKLTIEQLKLVTKCGKCGEKRH